MTPEQRMYKLATAVIEMGSPEDAGKGIADIVKFMLRRISPQSRPKSMTSLRKKIWELNENEISSKKTPPSASMGQAITFIKTILIGHNPSYIRDVISHIVTNLH